MKLIKQGEPLFEDQIFHIPCKKCKALWEIQGREFQRSSDQRDGDAMKFKCDCCSYVNWYNKSILGKFKVKEQING